MVGIKQGMNPAGCQTKNRIINSFWEVKNIFSYWEYKKNDTQFMFHRCRGLLKHPCCFGGYYSIKATFCIHSSASEMPVFIHPEWFSTL